MVDVDDLIREDRAIYTPTIERCYWCRDERDPEIHRPMFHGRGGLMFCSESCRRQYRRALRRDLAGIASDA